MICLKIVQHSSHMPQWYLEMFAALSLKSQSTKYMNIFIEGNRKYWVFIKIILQIIGKKLFVKFLVSFVISYTTDKIDADKIDQVKTF